eukprot:Rmarinus@m.28489
MISRVGDPGVRPSVQPDPPIKVGGRLQFFVENWRRVDPPQRLLSILREGLWWPIDDIDGTAVLCGAGDSFDALKKRGQLHLLQAMQDTVDQYIQKGLVRVCNDREPGLISLLFPVEKKGGKWRGCLDLRPLNQLVPCEHFKMEGLVDVKHVVRRGDFMTKVDISDAYSHVPVHPSRRRYLRFLWRGVLYEFLALPFGLNIAPREFTKLMRPVVGYLRQRGVRCLIYLDDILLVAKGRRQARSQTRLMVQLLRDLGFVINEEKCQLSPSRQMTFLGMEIDTVSMMFLVPNDRMKGLLRQVRKTRTLHRTGRLTPRLLASLTGKMVSIAMAVRPARLFCRQLLTDLQLALHRGTRGWDAKMFLSCEALEELQWWPDNLRKVNGRRFDEPETTATLFTDASDSGWGGVLFKGFRTTEAHKRSPSTCGS